MAPQALSVHVPSPTSLDASTAGELVIVSLGMCLGSHLSPLSKSFLQNSEIVFAGVSDPLFELWLASMHADVRSLQHHYQAGRSRRIGYEAMVEQMLQPVRAGKRVCGAFYGHAGVFAWPTHRAIEQARAEGFKAHMQAGISAEDCLYADLGIDPGQFGCQHFEASQLMVYQRQIDSSAYLILWQVGVAGDLSFSECFSTDAYRALLIELLLQDYPSGHPVIIYRAATLPTQRARIEQSTLEQLQHARIEMADTLVVPPARPMSKNSTMLARLAQIERSLSERQGTKRDSISAR